MPATGRQTTRLGSAVVGVDVSRFSSVSVCSGSRPRESWRPSASARPLLSLVGAFVVAHAELLLVALGLSLFREFTAGVVIGVLGAVCAVTVFSLEEPEAGSSGVPP